MSDPLGRSLSPPWTLDDLVALEQAEALLEAERLKACVCNVGVQECGLHPGRLLSKEERIAFRKEWDAKITPARVPLMNNGSEPG